MKQGQVFLEDRDDIQIARDIELNPVRPGRKDSHFRDPAVVNGRDDR